jgi:hypothetical protein
MATEILDVRRLSAADIDDILKWASDHKLRDPLIAYAEQRANALRREVPFLLSFSEWWHFWKDHYPRRGAREQDFCMARKGDQGPYALDNVYLATTAQNRRDYQYNPVAKDINKQSRKEKLHAELREMAAQVMAFVGPRLPYELFMARRNGLLESETRS